MSKAVAKNCDGIRVRPTDSLEKTFDKLLPLMFPMQELFDTHAFLLAVQHGSKIGCVSIKWGGRSEEYDEISRRRWFHRLRHLVIQARRSDKPLERWKIFR